MELLRRSCDDLGQTIVVVTHDAHAASFADRVVFLRDGQVVKDLCFESNQAQTQRLRLIIEEIEKIES
jgi:putative ABC transport system ATP-binding protein